MKHRFFSQADYDKINDLKVQKIKYYIYTYKTYIRLLIESIEFNCR